MVSVDDMRGSWRPPLWFDRPVGRILFLRELDGVSGVRTGKSKKYPGGFTLLFTLAAHGVPTRHVTITFPRGSPTDPKVVVDGPTDSPHRYADGTLCMWYPGDPPERRWRLADGAAALVANIAAHLVREEWYRTTGEWLGEEVWHGRADPENDPESIKEGT